MSADLGKQTARLVAENAESYGWANLTLAVQLLLPLAVIALIFARKRIWIYPYPLLDTYISALCPSFSHQQRLLKWMSSRIPHMNNLPNKITQYWQNGSLLCTLINTVVPGACPNPQKHWKKPPTHGQALAYKYLGVAPVLTGNDFNKQTLTSYSERKFIKYLLSVQEAINKVTIEEDSLKFTSKYVARGMGLVIGEQNRPSVFYIYSNTGSNKMENILVNIKGPYNTFGGRMITSSNSNESINSLSKMRKDIFKEQHQLAYKSKAQRSFFRSVSLDISPIMNLIGNRKNTGEITVTVEMEDERAKITFLPKFSGIYELLLTNDGQHLHGSPFVIRIIKSNKEMVDILQDKTKLTRRRIERKILAQSIDFISESVTITDESCLKLDSNNNSKDKDPKETYESNKSDDESTYQDSGIFDVSDQATNRSRITDLEDTDQDPTRKVEEPERIDNNLKEQTQRVIVHEQMPNDVKFLTKEFEKKIAEALFINDDTLTSEEESVDDGIHRNLEERIFGNAELQNNQDFENLYNKCVEDEDKGDLSTMNAEEIETKQKYETVNEMTTDFQNLNNTDFDILSNIPQFQKGRKITSSSVERMVEVFEKDSTNKNMQNEIFLTVAEKDVTQSTGFTDASPVLTDIAQEATDVCNKVPAEDSAHLTTEDGELSSKERHAILPRDHSIYICDEAFDTNVREMKNVFEKKQDVKPLNRRSTATWKRQNALQDSMKTLAKSLPNLSCGISKDPLLDSKDEFVIKFKEKRSFWNNLILQNSNTNLNISTSDIISNNTKSLSNQFQTVSQSTNSLNSPYRSSKSTINKLIRRKEELHKTNSLDLSNTYKDEDGNEEKSNKITRAQSLYDRIRIFDKDFDSGKQSTLLKRVKDRSERKHKIKNPEIAKPGSLTEVPNKTSNDQIEEDLRFAEIMKERFEISRRYFCSLESLTGKPNLVRRHSMESKPSGAKDNIPLQRGGSLKVLNVLDKFSLDNIYKDVILSKLKNCNFRGSPNKEAVVETLSSVSSSENFDCEKEKDHVEEDDLNMQFFNIKKRLRKRRSIKSIFDVNY